MSEFWRKAHSMFIADPKAAQDDPDFAELFRSVRLQKVASRPFRQDVIDFKNWLEAPVPLGQLIDDPLTVDIYGANTLVIRTRFFPKQYFMEKGMKAPGPAALAVLSASATGWTQSNRTRRFREGVSKWRVLEGSPESEIEMGFRVYEPPEEDWLDLV